MKYFLLVFLFVSLTFTNVSFAEDKPLKVSSESQVSAKGEVEIRVIYENISGEPLYHVHPMFHFHHSMDMAPMVMKLNPGEIKQIVNKNHPKLLRIGRYPLAIFFKYKLEKQEDWLTQTFMDSFFYEEKLGSAVSGKIETLEVGERSRLRIWIKNPAESFKNVRLMLLLPPGLFSDSFKNMLGFTIRGGEEKSFEVDVEKMPESLPGVYPIHLIIEYGEMQKHYSREIKANLTFNLPWNEALSWGHTVAFLFLASFIAWSNKKNGWVWKKKRRI